MTCHSEINIFLRIEPDISSLTHQHGIKPHCVNGKPIMHKTPELKSLEAFYESLLFDHAPEKPWNCPIHLTTIWTFLRPKSRKGKFKVTRPDTDNLIKTLKDCMKRTGYFTDDEIVVSDHVVKKWAPASKPHGITIVMRDLTNENKED